MPLGYCPAMLMALRNIVTPNSATEKITSAGALYAVLDPQNYQGQRIETGLSTGTGHLLGVDITDSAMFAGVDTLGKPVVNLKYYAPNQGTIQSVKDCAGAVAPVVSETSFSMQFYKQKTLKFRFAQLARLCEDATKQFVAGSSNSIQKWGVNTPTMNEVAMVIEGEMRGLVAAINADMWTRLVAGIGTNAASGDALSRVVDVLNADGSPNYLGYNTLLTDWMLNETVGKPIIVGGTTFNSFAMLQKWACCNNSGIDWNAAFNTNPMMPYFDPLADTALGAGQFLMIAPGSVQFVKHNFYKNAEMYGRKFGTSEYGTMVDRRLPGIEFDLEVREVNCPDPFLEVVISLNYDLFVNPATFGAGDVLTGNRGVYRYTAT